MTTQEKQQNKISWSKRISGGLNGLRDILTSSEVVIADLLAIVTPWLAPLIPAAMVHRNMIDQLGFDPGTALAGALAVEFLGFSAINTAVAFWRSGQVEHTKAERSIGSKQFWIATGVGVFYIAIILLVNAILEACPESKDAKILAKALLSLLSVAGGIIIALRTGYRAQLREAAEERELRRQSRQSGEDSDRTEKVQEQSKPNLTYEEYVRLNAARNGQGYITAEELMEVYDKGRTMAYDWQSKYRTSVGLDGRTGKPKVAA